MLCQTGLQNQIQLKINNYTNFKTSNVVKEKLGVQL